jgi:RNA polymerase sigma-70 factor, ECF subfamily
LPLDAVSFADNCESHREYLNRVALAAWPARFVADAGASDLVQQTLLRAFRNVEAFRGGSSRELRAWLSQILRNVVANEVRRLHCLKRTVDRRVDVPMESVADLDASSLSRMLQAEARSRLTHAIDQLRPAQAAVIRLRAFHGLTVAEIARKLNRSEAAIQKVWSRALATLEKELRGYVRPAEGVRS